VDNLFTFYEADFFEAFIYLNEYIFIIKYGGKNKMPNKDGTGPEGKGSKTGRQMGNCKEAKSVGRGFGSCGMRKCSERRCANKSLDKED
jgi:hypothetical protein